MITSKIKGVHHKYCHESAYLENGEWVPIEPLTFDCPHCRVSTVEEHDPCLGLLPGVKAACCGHGCREDAYIIFENGVKITGFLIEKDLTWQR